MKHHLSAILAFLLIGWSCQSWAVPDLGTITGDATYAGILDTGDQRFRITDLDFVDDDVTGLLTLELAGNAAINTSFIYDLDDPSRRLPVFPGPAGVFDSVVLTFDILTGTWDNGIDAPVIFTNDDAPIIGAGFGIGLTNGVDEFFSEDFRNPAGARQMGYFETEGAGGLLGAFQATACFEDIPLAASDMDYNDHCLAITDIAPLQNVTSPDALALVGLGLLALVVTVGQRRNGA